MDHSEFVSSLPTDLRTKLTETADGPGLRRLGAHLGILAISSFYIALAGPFWWLLLLPHSIALIFLFTLEHECTHGTPFRSGWLNSAAGRFSGLLLLLPFERFRAFHMAHHRFTNIPGKDPELSAPPPTTLSGFLWQVSGVPYWIGQAREIWQTARGHDHAPYLPERAKPRFVREARLHIVFYAGAVVFTALVSPVLVWIWWIPALLGQPFLRLYLMAEHGRCAFVPNMFENTRTTFTNRIVRSFAWNMPYHVEHHTMPTVPFHKLPEVHTLTREHLQVTAEGYAEYTAETLKTLRAGG